MVKGVSKRVVVVKSPEGETFEQALFIVREESGSAQKSRGEVLREACRLAERCAQPGGRAQRRRQWQERLGAALAGAGVTGAAWLITALL